MLGRATCMAFTSHKGGTGKTTSCLSVAGCLAMAGKKVLIIDMDPEANATMGFGYEPGTIGNTIFDAFLDCCKGYRGCKIKETIHKTKIQNIHLIPSELDLAVMEKLLLDVPRRSRVLHRIINDIRSFYDFILIDLPPSSPLLMINGISAADHLVIPVDPSIFSLKSLKSMKHNLQEIRSIEGHEVESVTILLCRFQKTGLLSSILGNESASDEIRNELEKIFGEPYVIPFSNEVFGSQKAGIPLPFFAPKCPAAKAYERVTDHVIEMSQADDET